MKILAWMLILSISILSAHSQTEGEEVSQEIVQAKGRSVFSKASALFVQGKYGATIEELTVVETSNRNADKATLGLAAYWKGICYNRLQDFPKAIESFDRALGLDYRPVDLNYEYGQALYASEKYQEARIQFRESLKRKFKRAISLYYIGFISRELGDRKKAVTFLHAIEKLPAEETKDVLQAAEYQIGDIYLDQVEKSRDAFRSVETYVIPQYRRALAVNENSNLAQGIRDRIIDLQRKYDLVMFNLRNGRPVLNPPYFLRASLEVGQDTNVTFSPTETTVAKSKQSSLFTKGDFIGRYTFYKDNYLSFSPELRLASTYYHNRVAEIYRNDNYLIAPSIRTAYEHSIWDKPASTLLDYEFSQSQRDVNAEKKLVFSSRSHAVMLGERFNYFKKGETTVRLRYRLFDSYNDATDSKTVSLSGEQVISFGEKTLLLFLSYDRSRATDEVFDTDGFTARGDFIFGRSKIGTPSIGLMLTSLDPINNRSERGRELLINPSARLSKLFAQKWRGNLKYDYQDNQSKDEDGFAYKKSIYSVEIEYLF
ncbi:MAG: tetratricopeptide repeat protein [Bdellovibrionota bacterium]